jgi:hypothetical protein
LISAWAEWARFTDKLQRIGELLFPGVKLRLFLSIGLVLGAMVVLRGVTKGRADRHQGPDGLSRAASRHPSFVLRNLPIILFLAVIVGIVALIIAGWSS